MEEKIIAVHRYVDVYYNLGSKFGERKRYSPTGWNAGGFEDDLKRMDGEFSLDSLKDSSIAGLILEKSGLLGKLESAITSGALGNPYGGEHLDALDVSTGLSVGISGDFNVGMTIPVLWIFTTPWFLDISVGTGGGSNASATLNGVTVRMMDMDGDGLPDRVLRVPGSKTFVQINGLKKVGLLKKISLPQGGSCLLEYEWEKGTVNMPQSRYVLSRVTREDGAGRGMNVQAEGEHRYEVEYEYEGGYYDRTVKEFYGFERVVSRYSDGSRKAVTYYNDRYYRKGMVLREEFSDGDGTVLRSGWYTVREAPFAQVKSEGQTVREAGSAGEVERTTDYSYDHYGNVTEMRSRAGVDLPELRAVIRYKDDFSTYLHAHPLEIRVYDDGREIRRRGGEYNERGSMTKLYRYFGSDERERSVSELEWDGYGNLSAVVEWNDRRNGSPGVTSRNPERFSRIAYGYDGDLHQYVERIERYGSGEEGYRSSMEWDKALGVKVLELDENGLEMRYEYDGYGRLRKVYSPYDRYPGGTPAVAYEYFSPEGKNWYTVTRNKVGFDGGDNRTITTVVMIDGLGRGLLTAKEGVVREDAGQRVKGWNVSGAVKYDGKGRTIEEGQIRFVAGAAESVLTGDAYTPGLVNVTKKEYDGLDRVVRVTLPDGARMETVYGIGNPNETYTRTVDPLMNLKEEVLDARGNITGVKRYDREGRLLMEGAYRYNGMGELVEARAGGGLPIQVEYDLLGRRTAMESADMGRKEYGYDLAGNLSWETDGELRRRGKWIAYEYDGLNRLLKVQYPAAKGASGGTEKVYRYGASGAAENGAGRVIGVENESGRVEYGYGLLGEQVREKRTVRTMSGEKTKEMRYQSDYLGRMETIRYPDGEVVKYEYDEGGQVTRVSGVRGAYEYEYVKEIGYDEYGQRRYIEYGNGVSTEYRYDPKRRWLCGVESVRGGNTIQDMNYRFDAVGNVVALENRAGRYSTRQEYTYDGLYQLTLAEGTSTQYRYQGGSIEAYRAEYKQEFSFDGVGNLLGKKSAGSKTHNVVNGMELNYDLEYRYYEGYGHRAEKIGEMYYRYDLNGNVTEERYGSHSRDGGAGRGYEVEGDLYSSD
jgi:YD repeat-containing protein